MMWECDLVIFVHGGISGVECGWGVECFVFSSVVLAWSISCDDSKFSPWQSITFCSIFWGPGGRGFFFVRWTGLDWGLLVLILMYSVLTGPLCSFSLYCTYLFTLYCTVLDIESRALVVHTNSVRSMYVCIYMYVCMYVCMEGWLYICM